MEKCSPVLSVYLKINCIEKYYMCMTLQSDADDDTYKHYIYIYCNTKIYIC